MEVKSYLEASPEAGNKFYQHFHDNGRFVMLNLLKYRAIADYSGLDEIEASQALSGEEAYRLYMEYTLPLLEKAGSKVLYFGESHHFVIGPENEKWDAILLVEHESVAKFLEFSMSSEYLKTAGHRRAALEDSRLLPSGPLDL